MNLPIKADELRVAWNRQVWKPTYLFTGQEDFLIEEATRQCYAHWIPQDEGGLNKERFDGDLHAAQEMVTACQTVPFMGTIRVVEIQNTHKISAPDQQRLADALAHLPPSTRLLFVWGKEWRRDDLKRPLVEAVLKTGQVVVFWPFFPAQAQRWTMERAKYYRKIITPEAASWLVQEVGESLRILDQELVKASCFVGERPEIALEDIQTAFGFSKAASPYEWLTSIRQKKGDLALKLLHRLLEEGAEPLYLLILISRSLRDWISAKGSPENSSTWAARFRLRRGEENQFIQDMAKLSMDELIGGVAQCVTGEQAIKTGQETPEMVLTLLTLGLCRFQMVHAFR